MRRELLLVGIMLLLGLTGCGEEKLSIDDYGKVDQSTTSDKAKSNAKEKADNNSDGKEDAEASDMAKNTESEIKMGANGIPEHVTCVLNEGEVHSVNVDATVTSLGIEGAKPYKIEKLEVDDAYLINLANALFDDGKYDVVFPYKYWEVSDLEAENERFAQLQNEADEEGKGYEIRSGILENLKKASLGGMANNKPTFIGTDNVVCEDEASNMCPYLYEKDRFAKLRGTIDGKEYELSYNACIGVKSGDLQQIVVRPLFPISSTSDANGDIKGENPVKQSDAEAKAKVILNELGLDDYVMTLARDRVCKSKNRESFYDGVELHYVRAIGGLSNNMSEYLDIIDYENVEKNNFTELPQEYIDFTYGEGGIYGIDISVCYQIGEVLAEDVKMLDFEQVLESAENYMKNEIKKNNNYYQYLDYIHADNISDIRLSYVPVKYKDQFVYMPMWCFGYDATNTTIFTGVEFTGAFAVGALDGKVYMYNWPQIEGQ